MEDSIGADQGVALTGDRLYESGFTAAVRTEYRDVLSRADVKIEAIQGEEISSLYEDVLEFQ